MRSCNKAVSVVHRMVLLHAHLQHPCVLLEVACGFRPAGILFLCGFQTVFQRGPCRLSYQMKLLLSDKCAAFNGFSRVRSSRTASSTGFRKWQCRMLRSTYGQQTFGKC